MSNKNKCDMCGDSESLSFKIIELAKHFRQVHRKFLCNVCCTGRLKDEKIHNGILSHYSSHIPYNRYCIGTSYELVGESSHLFLLLIFYVKNK
ncbi:hypothetical protein GBA52_006279 [Prunus armeniaca]|nr:hypothetical protein GBA52_006279 [Prunus armeniaca]